MHRFRAKLVKKLGLNNQSLHFQTACTEKKISTESVQKEKKVDSNAFPRLGDDKCPAGQGKQSHVQPLQTIQFGIEHRSLRELCQEIR